MSYASPMFKGLSIPYNLIDDLGMYLAMKLAAFEASTRFFDFDYAGLDPLSNFDIQILIGKGICENYVLKQQDVMDILKAKPPQILSLSVSLEKCTWCKCYTSELHSLNYCIEENIEGIPLCPNCHCEFRRLVGRSIFRITKEYQNLFDDLYQEGNND